MFYEIKEDSNEELNKEQSEKHKEKPKKQGENSKLQITNSNLQIKYNRLKKINYYRKKINNLYAFYVIGTLFILFGALLNHLVVINNDCKMPVKIKQSEIVDINNDDRHVLFYLKLFSNLSINATNPNINTTPTMNTNSNTNQNTSSNTNQNKTIKNKEEIKYVYLTDIFKIKIRKNYIFFSVGDVFLIVGLILILISIYKITIAKIKIRKLKEIKAKN